MLSSNSTSSAPHSVVIQSMPLGFLLQSCAVVLPAERVAFLEDALVDSRRSAARDLTRSSTPASFVNGMLSSFVLDDFGRVNFHAVSASASRLILPRELAVFVVSTVAVSLHMQQAATGSTYRGCISARAVPAELENAGYWVSATKVECLSRSFIEELLQVKLFCRPSTGWTGSNNAGEVGVWLPRSRYSNSHAASSQAMRVYIPG